MVVALSASAPVPALKLSGFVTVMVANGETGAPTVSAAFKLPGDVTVAESVSLALPRLIVSELLGLVNWVSAKLPLLLCKSTGVLATPLSWRTALLRPGGRLKMSLVLLLLFVSISTDVNWVTIVSWLTEP